MQDSRLGAGRMIEEKVADGCLRWAWRDAGDAG